MMDAMVVAWKEWRELLGQRGVRGKSGIILLVAVFGIALPLQSGPAWITSPLIALAWAWVPMFLVMTVIADAVAGERERHTLETLLATRLSDHAILFGKLGAAIGYAGTVTALSVIVGLVTVNLAHRESGLLLYDSAVVLAMGVFGLLGAVLVAAVGVLISLRAPTVRQAQQTLGGVIIVSLVLPMAIARLLPAAWARSVLPDAAHVAQFGMVVTAVFLVLDVGALAITAGRFRRARMIAGL